MTELMLKLAAFLAMVIDHAAACRLDRVFFPAFSKVYMISRAIGRMAFPIYTFCLVEGFRHSHDLRRYGGRLLLLGVISQLPYAFTLNRWYLEPAFGEVFPADPSRAFRNLNILFTLFIGLVLLVFFHKKPLARVIQSKGFAVFLLACGGFAVYTAEPEFDSRFRRLCTVLLLASAIAVALLHVWRKRLALRDWLARFAVLVFAVLLFERYPLAHLRCNIDYGVWGILLILCLSYAESRWSRALVVLLWGALFYSSLGMPDWFDPRHGGGSAPSAAVQRRAQPETAPEAEQSLLCGVSAAPRGDLGDGDCSERSADAAQAVEVLFVNRKKQTDRVNVGLFFAGFKQKFCILILASVPCASSVRALSVCKIYSQIALVQLYGIAFTIYLFYIRRKPGCSLMRNRVSG